jgi:ABC-type multidrug transport system fused ATPase/permease subunit
VIDALDRLMQGRTCLVVAHHLGAIRHADVVFVFDHGALVAHGSAQELLKDRRLAAEFSEQLRGD